MSGSEVDGWGTIKATQNIQLECEHKWKWNRIDCKKLPNRVQTHALCASSASMRLNERADGEPESISWGWLDGRLTKSFSNGLFICDMNCEMWKLMCWTATCSSIWLDINKLCLSFSQLLRLLFVHSHSLLFFVSIFLATCVSSSVHAFGASYDTSQQRWKWNRDTLYAVCCAQIMCFVFISLNWTELNWSAFRLCCKRQFGVHRLCLNLFYAPSI